MKPRTIIARWRLACAPFGAAMLALGASLSAQTVPAPFVDVDLGSPSAAGSILTNADGSFTLTGNGAGIGGTADQANYYYTWVAAGQWAMQFKVDSDLTGGDAAWAECACMVRASDPVLGPQPGDAFISIIYTKPSTDTNAGTVGANYLGEQFRSVAYMPADRIISAPFAYRAPVWLKLERNAGVFSCLYSLNGTNWTDYIDLDTSKDSQVGAGGTTFGTPFPLTVTVGIAVSSHDNTATDSASVQVSNLQQNFPSFTPPTAFGASVQNQNWTNYPGCEASFSFVVTNNGPTPHVPFLTANIVGYQWFKNGAALPGATGTNLTWLIDPSNPAEKGAQVYCQATVPPPWRTSVRSLKSTTNTLTVLRGGLYYTNGVKLEYFAGHARADLESGNTGPANGIGVQQAFDNPGGLGANYATRSSGWFIPPATDNYVFFVAGADDADLFLSTDASMANKTLIAQEPGWSPFDSWLDSGSGGPTDDPQKRSDQWTPDASGINPPYPNGIPLTAGQPYYLELDHHAGVGPDNFSATYQTIEQITNADWSTTFIDGAPSQLAGANGNLVLATWAATYLKWAKPPANVAANQGSPALFTAQAVSDGEFALTYQWFRDNQPIPGANESSYLTPITQPADDGAQFFVVAGTQEGGLSSTSSVASLTVASGVWEPGWAKVEWWYTNNPAGVNNLAALEHGSLGPAQVIVAAPQVGARMDDAGPNYDNGRITCWVVPPVSGLYTFYVCSAAQADLYLSPHASPADRSLIAQETASSGPLQWLSSAGGSSLAQKSSDGFIPPDAPAGTAPPYPGGIQLNAGQRYYLELDHLSGPDGDNCEATATPTGAPPIDYSFPTLAGSSIGDYFPRCAYVAFTNQPANVSGAPFHTVTFTAGGITDSRVGIMGQDDPASGTNNFLYFQWMTNGAPVPGANGGSFSLEADPWLNQARIACQMRALGYADAAGAPLWSNSAPALLTVLGSNSAVPALAFAGVFQQNLETNLVLDLRFNQPMNPASLLNAAYNVPGCTLGTMNVFTNASKNLSPTSEALTLDEYASIQIQLVGSTTNPLTVTVTGAEDAWGHPLPTATANIAQTPQLADTDIGVPGDPAVPGLLWINGPDSYTIQCEGSDIGNANDGFNFAWQPVSGDFDVVVRVVDATHTSNSAKAGLMVRETLDAGSRNWNIVCDPSSSDNLPATDGSGDGANTFEDNCRNSTAGGSAPWTTSYFDAPPQYPNAWLRLKRTGQDLFCFYSNDAVHWVPRGHDNPALAGDKTPLVDPVYLGLCQAAHANDTAPVPAWTALSYLATVDYAGFNAHFVETPAAPPAPALVPGAPAIVYASFYTNHNLPAGPAQTLDLKFNKPMDPASLLGATYNLTGLTVTAVTVYTNVSLNLSPASEAASNNFSSALLTVTGTPAFPLAITVKGAQDYWGNPLVSPGNAASANLCPLINQDLGVPPLGTDPSVPGVLWVNGPGSYSIQCEGSDIYNAADGFNFSYVQLTNDFDVVVRVKDATHTSDRAKAGLMVRETLAPGSRNWSIVNDPDSSDGLMALDGSGPGASLIECNARNTTGGATAPWQIETNGMAPAYPHAWVRLQRSGATLAAYFSTNGTGWVQQASDNPATVGAKTSLPAAVYVGICQSAHNNDPAPFAPFTQPVFIDTVDYDSFNAAYVAPVTTNVTLIIKRSGSKVLISWAPAGGTLLSSPALGAKANWQPVANPANPMTVPIGHGAQYFRVR